MLYIPAIKALYELSGIPVLVMDNEKILYRFDHGVFNPNPALFIMKKALDSGHPICYTITPEYYFSGLVRAADSGVYVLIGPATSFEHDKKRVGIMLSAMSQPPGRLWEFLKWLNIIPDTGIAQFKATVKMIDFILNGSCDRELVNTMYVPANTNMSDTHTDLMSWGHYHHHNFEIELTSCIEYGRVEQTRELLMSLQDYRNEMKLPIRAKDAIRTMKNTYMFSTGIISRAAGRGGLSADIVNSLSDYYITKFETLDNYHSLFELFMRMAIDFAGRVAERRHLLRHSPLSLKISKLVGSGIYEKITPTMLSKKLNMDVSYLCRRFKKDTGKTITTYVNEVKISEAQRLLKNSELSVFEISERLGFSAQNYFQSVFKKITGSTPVEYRNSD